MKFFCSNGNMTAVYDTAKQFNRILSWDDDNRLTKTVDTTSGSSVTTQFNYDAKGMRIIKDGPYGKSIYVDTGYVESGAPQTTAPIVSNHIFVGNTRVASVVKHVEEKQPATYFYASDHLGSSSVLTNNAGSYHERIEYLPYGETWVEDKITSDSYTTPYKFTGKELDAETGLYYFGARYYDARVSRWISADPALAEGKYFPKPNDYDTEHDFYWYLQQDGSKKLAGLGGVFNAVNMDGYHYAGDNPVKLVDPDGEVLDIGIDIAFIGYDIYSLSTNEGYKDWINWAALGGDIVGAVTPFVTGVGAGIRTAKAVDKAVDTTKAAAKASGVAKPANKTVIGKLRDLKSLRHGENTLLKHLPDKGSPKLNWKQNANVLKQEMKKGLPIRDATVDTKTGELLENTGFLKAERELLKNYGWKYDPKTNLWLPPNPNK